MRSGSYFHGLPRGENALLLPGYALEGLGFARNSELNSKGQVMTDGLIPPYGEGKANVLLQALGVRRNSPGERIPLRLEFRKAGTAVCRKG